MNAVVVKRAEAIFSMIVEAPECDRHAVLDDCCGRDEELRALVEDLLAEDSAHGTGPLDALPIAHAESAEPTHAQPMRVGRYEIVCPLGEGGMAVVYEARQNNPRRTVALKVVRVSGITSRDVLRRFLHEVQVLGQLRHHGIAQIYDAGIAPPAAGHRGVQQPYFAMELVRGDNLLEFARRADLPVNQRLELLARVCDAVEYAHQRGVIHRDLKPANIIIDESSLPTDAHAADFPAFAAQPKVLDFGVARVIGQEIQTPTMSTRAGQVIGTIAYMSPEQLSGDVEQTDTRSDVYALGVLLYQLLAGRLPHNLDNVPLPEVARRVRETDAPLLGAANAKLRGDIEIIAARALEKDRARRYQSARDLAADLRRHLRGEAIEARRDSAVYVLRKSIHRHRGVTAAISLVLIGLVAFSVYAWAQAQRLERLIVDEHAARVAAEGARIAAETARTDAESARKEADESAELAKAEAAKARKVSDFLGSILRMAGPAPDRQTKTLVDLLDEASAKLAKGELSATPDVEEEVRRSLAGTYSNLDLNSGALVHLRWLVERARSRHGELSKQHAHALCKLASGLSESSRTNESEEYVRRAVEILAQAAPGSREELDAKESLANTLMRLNRCEEALTIALETIDEIDRIHGKQSRRAASAHFNLAGIYRGLRRTDEMVREYEIALPVFEKHRNVGNTIRVRYYYALDVYIHRGRPAEAIPFLRRALTEAIRLLGHQHPETLTTERCLARALADIDEHDEALAIYERVADVYREQAKYLAVGEARAFIDLARSVARKGDLDRARAVVREFVAKSDRLAGEASNTSIQAIEGGGQLEIDLGDRARAADLGREIIDRAVRELPPGDDRLVQFIQRGCKLIER